ncbi:glutamate-5-semialdehyde dehydrogenase [Aspergillus clavatus NRRL 1]|uniref:glutamate-5-semialdehyde dehydrogenase n=1 Tax=Aspergillus clavatus (strain ATCC 1007 / CBS 513.65 / DSM 816 / NCTC 3887 / NRRL 1 / QM 1276 / 107) TaxID=344612 RepID=A1CSG8_ASPCL|nr:glutamate semialdehyde dehydrogenase [Aspergillus clavatus NRRL 1]EAW06255.1 glutamate semialdehyde dehydrogenase [Aspergillus clavatus NRRL 1]
MSLTESSALDIAKTASLASRQLATLSAIDRNQALTALHDALSKNKEIILEANARDVQLASRAAEDGSLSHSALKRLDLSRSGKYDDMLKGILSVRDLEDPIGRVTLKTLLDDGLTLERVTCPIGVLLIIFEARPEVIANIAALSIKSGNAAILKGGKESTESFIAISRVISEAISGTCVPKAAVQLVKTRDIVTSLLAQDSLIDLVIPRGSNDLVRFVKENTKIPVLGHADGLCSAYIHIDADLTIAVKVIVDSKTDYPAACNSLETLLVHEDALETIFPAVAEALLAKGVCLRCDAQSKSIIAKSVPTAPAELIKDAVHSDYDTEFLDLVLAVKTISSTASPMSAVETAIAHINSHSSKHTDLILTESTDIAEAFMSGVDSAGVFWNASTRFADGMRFGFGTEVGISTNKIHTRGPVGLDGLTIYKYRLRGQGHRASDYAEGEGGKKWKHESLALQ